jgi:hypothetical protein
VAADRERPVARCDAGAEEDAQRCIRWDAISLPAHLVPPGLKNDCKRSVVKIEYRRVETITRAVCAPKMGKMQAGATIKD